MNTNLPAVSLLVLTLVGLGLGVLVFLALNGAYQAKTSEEQNSALNLSCVCFFLSAVVLSIACMALFALGFAGPVIQALWSVWKP